MTRQEQIKALKQASEALEMAAQESYDGDNYWGGVNVRIKIADAQLALAAVMSSIADEAGR